jgi:hypothetical protein
VVPARVSSTPPSARTGEREVVIPFPPESIAPATAFRSTWIVASLQSLRERGHFDRYVSLLKAHRETIVECVAGTWLPIAVARAHYEACDALALGMEEQLAMGRAVGGRSQGSILATVAKAARGMGVTPWLIIPQFDRLWRRASNGGAVQVTKLGPKEARAEFVGCNLFDVAYFRQAIRGVLLNIGDLYCQRPYIHDLPGRPSGGAAFQLQWV